MGHQTGLNGFFKAALKIEEAFAILIELATGHLQELLFEIMPELCSLSRYYTLLADNMETMQTDEMQSYLTRLTETCFSSINHSSDIELLSSVIALMTELWLHFPAVFQQRDALSKSLGARVLHVFKHIAKHEILSLRVQLSTALFMLLEFTADYEMQETIFRLIAFFLLDWFEDQTLRAHMHSSLKYLMPILTSHLPTLTLSLC